MRLKIVFLLAVAILQCAAVARAQGGGQPGPGAQAPAAGQAGAPGGAPVPGRPPAGPPRQMRLTSTAFKEGATIPVKFTCANKPAGVTPLLEWTDVPRGTSSFTLIVHDLEPRPRKGVDDILHWMVWNMPGSAVKLPENVPIETAELPDGSHQSNGNPGDGGNFGYRGPCAPVGIPHHYSYDLFALDQKLDLPAKATRADVLKAMDGHIVGHAVLIGLYNQ